MQVLLVLFVLGWLSSLPAVFWWTMLGLTVLVLGFGGYLLLDFNNCANFPWMDRVAVDRSYLRALQDACNEAEAEVQSLRAEIKQLRCAPAVAQPDPTEALYRRVGLSPGAPLWLVATAQRGFRQRLHPDCHPEHRKEEAERRFKMAEGVFDQIATSRS